MRQAESLEKTAVAAGGPQGRSVTPGAEVRVPAGRESVRDARPEAP